MKQLAERSGEWVPRNFELRFGLPFEEPFDSASIRDPVTLPGGWKLRGAVDLIEESPKTGTLRVTDHKSGANRTREGTVVGGGEVLQPVLYSLAVEAIFEGEVSEGRLDFCTVRGGFTDRVVTMDKWARQYARRVMEAIDVSIQEGKLPPSPREWACGFCDFRPVCGRREDFRTRMKSRDLLSHLDDVRQLP
jgi:CRISPR/Cas system-associated exonuclease Cas4 (RecB family)